MKQKRCNNAAIDNLRYESYKQTLHSYTDNGLAINSAYDNTIHRDSKFLWKK